MLTLRTPWFRRLAWGWACLVPLGALAQTPAATPAVESRVTVRDLVLQLAVGVSRRELADCQLAHPGHGFETNLDGISTLLGQALDRLPPERAADLAQAVPAPVQLGQDLMLALFAQDNSLRTLAACQKTTREILALTPHEADGLVGALVTTVARLSRDQAQAMARALR